MEPNPHDVKQSALPQRLARLAQNVARTGIDIDEKIAAKYPMHPITDGGTYTLDRTLDGAVVKP